MKYKVFIWIFAIVLLVQSVFATFGIGDASRSFVADQVSGIAYDYFNDTILVARNVGNNVTAFMPNGTELWTCDISGNNLAPNRGIAPLNGTHFVVYDGDVAGQIQIWEKGAGCGPNPVSYDSLQAKDTRGLWIAPNGSDEYLYSIEITGASEQLHRWKQNESGGNYNEAPDASFSLPSGSDGMGTMFNIGGNSYFLIGMDFNGGTKNISRFKNSNSFGNYDNYAKQLLDPTNSVAVTGMAVNITLDGSIQFFYANATNNRIYQASINTTIPSSLNISIFDEIKGNKIDFFNGIDVSLEIVTSGYSINNTINESSYFIDDILPGDYRISYSSDGYTERDYYFNLENSTDNQIELYLLSTGNDTDITLTIDDENARELANATIKLLRYYVSSNSYKIVAMSRSDQSGKAQINIEAFNAFYYFIIDYKGSVVLTTNPSRIIETGISYTVFVGEDILKSRKEILDVTHDLSFNNATKQFRFVYNDPGSILKEACLVVERIGPQEETEICNTCQTSSAGTILCTVNTTLGRHIGYGRIETTTQNSPYFMDILEVASDAFKEKYDKFGDMGVYMASYVIMALALLGTPFPWLSILLSIVGIVFSAMMGILGLEHVAIVAIICIAAMIVGYMKR